MCPHLARSLQTLLHQAIANTLALHHRADGKLDHFKIILRMFTTHQAERTDHLSVKFGYEDVSALVDYILHRMIKFILIEWLYHKECANPLAIDSLKALVMACIIKFYNLYFTHMR